MNHELRHIGHGLISRLLWIAAGFCLCLALHGCRSARTVEAERAEPVRVLPVTAVDTTRTRPGHVSVPVSKPGFFLSTPAGIERRHARRLAKASVPRRLGKGAVYAPLATQVAAGYKNRAAVINADSGATVTAIEKAKAPLAIGAGATATQTNPTTGLSYWWLLLLLIPAGWLARKLFIPYA